MANPSHRQFTSTRRTMFKIIIGSGLSTILASQSTAAQTDDTDSYNITFDNLNEDGVVQIKAPPEREDDSFIEPSREEQANVGSISGTITNVSSTDEIVLQLRSADNPVNPSFLAGKTLDISEDGSFEVSFDLGDENSAGNEFFIEIFLNNEDYEELKTTDAVLVESLPADDESESGESTDDESESSESTDDESESSESTSESTDDRTDDDQLIKPLSIKTDNPTVIAGKSQSVDIQVTNNRDETLTDIEGKLFVDNPLDSTNDETFTTALDPGETTTISVDVSASDSATAQTYPAGIDFRYTDRDGDTKITDPYQLMITVNPRDQSEIDESVPGLGIGSAATAIGATGYILKRRLADDFE